MIMESNNIVVIRLGEISEIGDWEPVTLSSQEGAWFQGYKRGAQIPCSD